MILMTSNLPYICGSYIVSNVAMIFWVKYERYKYVTLIGYFTAMFGALTESPSLAIMGTIMQLTVISTHYTTWVIPIVMTGALAGLTYAIEL